MTKHLNRSEIDRCLEDLDHGYEDGRSVDAPQLSFIERHSQGCDRPTLPPNEDDDSPIPPDVYWNGDIHSDRMHYRRGWALEYELSNMFFKSPRASTTQGGVQTDFVKDILNVFLLHTPIEDTNHIDKEDKQSNVQQHHQNWWENQANWDGI